jgi:hypothetical protein
MTQRGRELFSGNDHPMKHGFPENDSRPLPPNATQRARPTYFILFPLEHQVPGRSAYGGVGARLDL